MALAEPSLAVADPDDDADEVVYELDDWPVDARVQVTSRLMERGIPYRWEPGLALVVSAPDDEGTGAVLDDVEATMLDEEWDDEAAGLPPDPDLELEEDDGGDDDVAQAAMGDLFVAADRLMHEPSDDLVAAELGAAAAMVDETRPPYGIDPELWDRVRALAATVLADLEEGADDEVVGRDARVLRDVLRPWV